MFKGFSRERLIYIAVWLALLAGLVYAASGLAWAQVWYALPVQPGCVDE